MSPNKNIEWEAEFWEKFGGGDKIALNLNGDIYLMGKVQDAIDFIRQTLQAQREQICKDCCITCKSMIEYKYAKQNK